MNQPYKEQQNNYQRGGGRGKDPAITKINCGTLI